MRTLKLLIKGRVQGVGFRFSTKRFADKSGIKGYIKNLINGGVEIVAQGDVKALQDLVVWAHRGPSTAEVESVTLEDTNMEKVYEHFSIMY